MDNQQFLEFCIANDIVKDYAIEALADFKKQQQTHGQTLLANIAIGKLNVDLQEENVLLKQEMETKNMAAASALNEIAYLFGSDSSWEYPGQVVRLVQEKLGKYICRNCKKVFDSDREHTLHITQMECEEKV